MTTIDAAILATLTLYPRASIADLMAETGADRAEVIASIRRLVGPPRGALSPMPLALAASIAAPPVFVPHEELVERMKRKEARP